jgi:hypothetical protein
MRPASHTSSYAASHAEYPTVQVARLAAQRACPKARPNGGRVKCTSSDRIHISRSGLPNGIQVNGCDSLQVRLCICGSHAQLFAQNTRYRMSVASAAPSRYPQASTPAQRRMRALIHRIHERQRQDRVLQRHCTRAMVITRKRKKRRRRRPGHGARPEVELTRSSAARTRIAP